MKRTLLLSILACLCSLRAVSAAENTLQVWSNRYREVASGGHPQVAVTAYLKRASGKCLLAFRLTNISKKPLTFYPSFLPWGSSSAITLAAITTDGRRLANIYPIDDPAYQPEITLAPGEFRQGNYDLALGVDLAKAPKNQDVLLLWSYRTPTDFNHRQPVCTGVVVIPKGR